MSYAQPADLIKRYDARVLGDLAEDAGTRVSPSGLLTDPNIQACLDDASGLIDSACQVGERYTQAQLAALTGIDQAILFRLNCDLAFVFLTQRRGVVGGKYGDLYKIAYERSDLELKRLKNGEAIFNVPGDVGAGLPNEQFPSFQAYATVDTLRSAACPLFPVRRYQQPSSN